MFHTRTRPLSEFPNRTQRFRISMFNPVAPPIEEAIYNGQTASFTAFAEILNGENASFTSYQRTIIPPDANGDYPVAEA
jgi:hypothetical protein